MRSRVLNPKWIDAMRRHGYKGAFELAATVDYLFGYDATAHVVEDWMYERVTDAYVADPDDPEVLRRVEPVGAAVDRRAAARGRRPRHVGRLRRAPAERWPTRCSKPRAGRSRGEPERRSRSAPSSARTTPSWRCVLAAVDPLIGGVLLRGDKGSAKTTLARGLAALLGDAPFVELPLGATEDRVVGTLDIAAALTGGEVRFQPGAARRRPRRRALRRRGQPARRPPRRRAARRRRLRRERGRARRRLAPPPGPVRARRAR